MGTNNVGSFSELLPVVNFGGTEFLVDIDCREFRHVDEQESTVSFYSEQGRRMIRAMAGTQWRRFHRDPHELDLRSS